MEESRQSGQIEGAVQKSVVVNLPVEDAFRLFTQGIGQWWPLDSQSLGQPRAETCVMEEGVGGRIYEIQSEGVQAEWGEIQEWEPPRRLVTTWHPGRKPESAQKLEVTFQSDGEGTRVDLTHSGWENLGDRAGDIRKEYVPGWDHVLGKYVEKAGAPS
jgi:uncharacterized protein YndB with AHSA1/START domain